MTDEDFVENYRELSPDKSMILINYRLELGGFGDGAAKTAVLKTADTTRDLTPFSLPVELINTKWIGNNEVSAQVDIVPLLRAGEEIEMYNTEINNALIQVSAFDHIKKEDHIYIISRKMSPDRKLELVAYKYGKNRREVGLLHVSVILASGKIPKYGNYFIGTETSDYIFSADWDKTNTIIFYSNQHDAGNIQYYLVHSREDIPYRIVKNDQKFGKSYRWP